MAMSTDPAENLEKAVAKVGRGGAAGAPQVVCLPELYRVALLLPEGGRTPSSTWPRPSPGRAPRRSAAAAKRHGVVVVVPIFERRAAGPLPQQRRHHRRRRRDRGPLPQDAHPRRPALLREVLLHPGRPRLPAFDTRPAGSARSSAGTSGTPRARGSPPCGAPRCSSTRPPSAGTRTRRPQYGAAAARRLADHPARATPSPTGSTWRSSTASASRGPARAAPGSSSGAPRSSAIRSAW